MEVEGIRGWQDFQSLRKVGFQILASWSSRNPFTHILTGWLFEAVTKRHHLLNITYYVLVSDIFANALNSWKNVGRIRLCFTSVSGLGWNVLKVIREQNMRWKIRWTISKKRLEIVYHETTIIAPHLFRYLCVIWIFFTSPAEKAIIDHRSSASF